MQAAFLVGRVLVGGYFLFNAFNHLAAFRSMSAYAAGRGVPLAPLAVALSGALLAIAGITLLFGWKPRVGVAALVLFLVPVTLIMHAFWKDTDPMTRANDLVHFTKNIALLGSALMFLAIPEPWPHSVQRRHGQRMGRPQPSPT